MVRSYRLKDMDCAYCATKIGNAVSALPGVKDAKMHFAARCLTVEFTGESAIETETRIRDTVRAIEPGTELHLFTEQTEGDVLKEEKENRKEFANAFIQIGISLLMLAAGILLGSIWPVLKIVFSATAYMISGFPVIKTAFLRLKNGQALDETLLMTIATLGAWALSEGIEATAVMVFYRTGETLQEMAAVKGRSDIRALTKLISDKAHVVLNEVVDIPTAAVLPGDILEVRTGERVNVDGVVVKGVSALNVSALTGEAAPVNCSPGDKVLSGSLNTGPMLRILCEKPADESTVARILRLTREETARKAAPERFLGRFASVYTPAVVLLAALVFLLPPLFMLGTFAEWGYRALLLLMISCPCALVLSVPLSYVAGMGDSARRGLLVKGGAVMEALSKVDALAMDKTGTLTEGFFRLKAAHPAKGVSLDALLEAAVIGESKAQHPLARGIIESPLSKEWLTVHPLQQTPDVYEEVPGKGVRVSLGGRFILCGSQSLLREEGVQVPPEHGGDQVHASENGKYLGSFYLSDTLRPEAADVLKKLSELNIRSMTVLTGDSESGAETIKGLDKITNIQTGLLPEGKVDAVREIASSGRQVAFVGDGINDAPVLAAAHVGIAIGGIGSQAAMEAADCVLAAGTLDALPEGIKTARRTARIVRVNVALALVIKLAVMILGIAGVAGMWMAVTADVGVSLLCVLLTGTIRLARKPHPSKVTQ